MGFLTLNSRSMQIRSPWPVFLAWVGLCCLIFFAPLRVLVPYSLANDNSSHILLIPLIVAWLLLTDRRKLPSSSSLDLPAALPFAVTAALIAGFTLWKLRSDPQTAMPFFTLSLILLLVAGFIGVFGRGPAQSVWFALAFQLFAVPLPESLLNRFIYVLQAGSADIAAWIFDITGVPALRDGFIFHLSDLNIEVARECSGIRSSIALVILAVLVAHFSFSKLWKKIVFVAAGLLMMVIKNGVRIATLTILAKYVDRDFLYGRLHHEGGVVFFLIGLALLVPLYWLLRRGDPLANPRNGTAATV
jgi:exosortase